MHSLSVDEQSEFLSNKIHEYIDLCVPLKTVTIGHKYEIREKLMTRGLLVKYLKITIIFPLMNIKRFVIYITA